MMPVALTASIAFCQNIASSEPTDVRVTGLWNPNDVATAAEWTAAHQKGARLTCRLEATDEAAGRLWQDTRNPPSARSQWADVSLRNELRLWSWFTGEYEQELHCHFSDDDVDNHMNKIGTSTLPKQPVKSFVQRSTGSKDRSLCILTIHRNRIPGSWP